MSGPFENIPHGVALARLRSELGITQAALAAAASLDQSRVSRIEKGEVSSQSEVEKVLDALSEMGSPHARAYKEFCSREWDHIAPPSFFNPQRACLEIADEALGNIDDFLSDESRPWPLRRQIERHRDTLVKGANYLQKMTHSVAFIGDIGVGKSTGLSFLFDLLVPPSLASKPIDRPVLETGAGGTTICEVHIKRGPEFGISLLPLPEGELRSLVSDFCAARWAVVKGGVKESADTPSISREHERAIRNMAGLTRRRSTADGKIVYHDPVSDLVAGSASEDEFRTRIFELMNLPERTRRELWYDSATRQHPMEWVMKTFREVNNGRLADVSLPSSIDLIIPEFGRSFGELEISIIDTKGVDDVAVREDLDLRLKDPRTAVVFCTRFNDAPGVTTRALLQHMQLTYSEPVNTGKVSLLALPRSEEAQAMKDDAGELALDDEEGYAFKRMQVENELAADNLAGVPMVFFNVQSDDPDKVRGSLFDQLNRMRETVEQRLFDLCAAADEVMKNHEAQALTAAMEEVAERLHSFLQAHTDLHARERHAYAEALTTINGVRYAATLWAATRRNGEYSGLNVVHNIGVGAAKDARLRSERWFASLNDYLAVLKGDDGLQLAAKTIDQMGRSALASRSAFLEAVQRAGMEVYRTPLAQAAVWAKCAGHWGAGPGFKGRVVADLQAWFEQHADLKEKLEEITNTLWDQLVIAPMRRLVMENAPEVTLGGNVIPFPTKAA
ncbi:XRE family transcriptional regulator (plasmid) [Sphingomonas sp. MM-1]|uniref:helix-turn-helix domain-containing protein n=1 Tax=Sphingomonadales TaxID=204457 RepID=UPI0002C0E690|nr:MULTISPECIES: helix-turn-helix transcriptional regulator [Sphingomonadaceae]AGH51759.1 XRE family transcriptional regulator [Sphingomonas sp. MM-1]UXC93768.1 helix-turn-helix domain-containing protein [Sphingobium sp. RSMS]